MFKFDLPDHTRAEARRGRPSALPVQTERPILQGEYPYGGPPFGRTFDIAPDGKRFLMLKEGAGGDAQEDPPNRFIVVENWFEELRQRVPTN